MFLGMIGKLWNESRDLDCAGVKSQVKNFFAPCSSGSCCPQHLVNHMCWWAAFRWLFGSPIQVLVWLAEGCAFSVVACWPYHTDRKDVLSLLNRGSCSYRRVEATHPVRVKLDSVLPLMGAHVSFWSFASIVPSVLLYPRSEELQQKEAQWMNISNIHRSFNCSLKSKRDHWFSLAYVNCLTCSLPRKHRQWCKNAITSTSRLSARWVSRCVVPCAWNLRPLLRQPRQRVCAPRQVALQPSRTIGLCFSRRMLEIVFPKKNQKERGNGVRQIWMHSSSSPSHGPCPDHSWPIGRLIVVGRIDKESKGHPHVERSEETRVQVNFR